MKSLSLPVLGGTLATLSAGGRAKKHIPAISISLFAIAGRLLNRSIAACAGLVIATAAVTSLNCTSHAASVAWISAHDVSGDSDVSILGTLVQASSLGDGTSAGTTVNGVIFAPYAVYNSSSGIFALSGANGYGGYGVNAVPFNTLSPAYKSLLTYGTYGSGTSVMTLTISGLTIGRHYLFQWWANDSRAAFIPQNVDATAGNTVELNADTTDVPGGTGQYAIGTFVADAATQNIDFQGVSNGTLENAFQLRDISDIGGVGPTITAIRILNRTNVALSAIGGSANHQVIVLSSTNIALPTTNWSHFTTNNFDFAGALSLTNGITGGETQRFFRLLTN